VLPARSEARPFQNINQAQDKVQNEANRKLQRENRDSNERILKASGSDPGHRDHNRRENDVCAHHRPIAAAARIG
jgi:hypothetical protein